MCIKSVMPSYHFILCCPLLLPSISPSIRVFSNESAFQIRWPKHWSFFSFSISPSSEYSGLISLWIGLTGLISLLSRGLSRGHVVVLFCISSVMCGSFTSSTSWPIFGIFSVFNFSHSSWGEYGVISHHVCIFFACLFFLALPCEILVPWPGVKPEPTAVKILSPES